MAYKDPIASTMLLTHLYSNDYTHFVSRESDVDNLSIHRSRVERLGKVRGRHLDYGCGAGRFVEAALLAGWDSFGGDPFLPDTIASSPLRGRLFRFDAADQNTIIKAGKFDCISMWAVIEHLTSFKDTFLGLASMLNPGGTIVFNSPNASSLIAKYSGSSWRMATLIEHIQFCTPLAIKSLAEEYGFKIQRLRICGAPFPFGKGGGVSDQGLGTFPIPVSRIMIDDSENGQTAPLLNQNSKIINRVMSCLVRAFLGNTVGQTFSATMIRQLINGLHLGDHIEVTLKLK
jgi:SAM-dependent methyltransferase